MGGGGIMMEFLPVLHWLLVDFQLSLPSSCSHQVVFSAHKMPPNKNKNILINFFYRVQTSLGPGMLGVSN